MRAAELGVESAADLLGAVDAVNLHQRQRTIELAAALVGGRPKGRRIAVLGAAFKGGSDDLRDSPALAVAHGLAGAGARIRVYDPGVAPGALEALGLHSSIDAESACLGAELVMVLSDWGEFAQLDPAVLGAAVSRRTVLDARLVLDPGSWTRAGWRFHGLGRGDVGERGSASGAPGLGESAARVEAGSGERRRAG